MQYGKDEAGAAVRERTDVNRDVIEEHYDERTDLETLDQRDLFDGPDANALDGRRCID